MELKHTNPNIEIVQRSKLRAILHLEAKPICCVKGQESSLILSFGFCERARLATIVIPFVTHMARAEFFSMNLAGDSHLYRLST